MKQLRGSPRALAIKVARARQYFPLIEEALEIESVPLDFKYLSLQESALISGRRFLLLRLLDFGNSKTSLPSKVGPSTRQKSRCT